MGELLHEARELFRYKRNEGGFAGWVDQRLCMSRSTAYELVSIFERFGSNQNVSAVADTLPKKVLSAIAAPKMPEGVRKELIARAERGERVTPLDVKRLTAEAKQAEEEAKLSPRKRTSLKAKREAERAAAERRSAEREQRCQREQEAAEKAAAIIVQKFGAEVDELCALMHDASSLSDLIDEIKSPGILKQRRRNPYMDRRHG